MSDQAASSSSNARLLKKKSKGQQRLPMKKIESKTSLMVTFCKRRAGLFKKASELCILCGVQIAIICFSPANKAYTFAHPSVDSVMEHFLADEDSDSDSDFCFHSNATFPQEGNTSGTTVERLCVELDELKDQMRIAEKCGEILAKVGNENASKSWWNKCIGQMNPLELEECNKAVKELAAATPAFMARASADPSVSLDLAL